MTVHAGWRDGRTLCGAWKGFNAKWTPGFGGSPAVDCPHCLRKQGENKR